MITKTSAEAESQLGELLDTVQREPVVITRHGRPAAFLISPRDLEDLQKLQENRKGNVTAFDAWAAKYADQISPEAARLTDEDIVRMVHEARDEAASGR